MKQEDKQGKLQKLVIQRSTEFFATTQFIGFSREMNKERINAKEIKQVFLKCYAYGYFQEYQVEIKKNLLSYIKACMAQCVELTSFKLILNGFSITDKYLQSILKAIMVGLQTNGNISTIWVHTNHLTECTKDDFAMMLQLIQEAGKQINREEISIQITHWTFQKPLTLFQVLKAFTSLIEGSSEMNIGLNFKKFRLQLSSWYLKTDQAYRFLRSGMDNNAIIAKLAITNEEAKNKTTHFLNNSINQSYSEFSSGKSDLERQVKKLINKSLNEEIIYHLVHNFQNHIVFFVSQLLKIMNEVQDFTLDLRNWNGLFKMVELSNKLQSKSGPRKEFSMIDKARKKASQVLRTQNSPQEERILRTTYLL